MVSLETISAATENPKPDLRTIINYLDETSGPQASAKNTLKVIAPAISKLHTRARTLQFELTAKNQKFKYKLLVIRAFKKITDHYAILAGIQAPADPVEKIEFQREIDFARKLIDISYRLMLEAGLEEGVYNEPLDLAEPVRQSYAAELKVIREEYPLPEFARKENMAKQGLLAANVSWIIFIIIILAQLGVVELIFEAIAGIFKGE
ncbi:hypothetical protein KAU08_09865 [bacterium]|nr:hypothetical protein [bacterium]